MADVKDPLGIWNDGEEVYDKKGKLSTSRLRESETTSTNLNIKVENLKKSLNSSMKSGSQRLAAVKELSAAIKELNAYEKSKQKRDLQKDSATSLQKEVAARLAFIQEQVGSRKGKQKNDLDAFLKDSNLVGQLSKLLSLSSSKQVDFDKIQDTFETLNKLSLPKFVDVGFKTLSKTVSRDQDTRRTGRETIATQNAAIKSLLQSGVSSVGRASGRLGMGILDRIGTQKLNAGSIVRGIGTTYKAGKSTVSGVKSASASLVNTYKKVDEFIKERSSAKEDMKETNGLIKKHVSNQSFFNRKALSSLGKIASKSNSSGLSAMLGTAVSAISTFFGPGGMLKTIASVLGPMGATLALLGKVVGGAGLVGLSGYLGFKAGEYLNDKFGLSDKLVKFAEFVRDKAIPGIKDTAVSAGKAVSSGYNSAVQLTSQGIEAAVNKGSDIKAGAISLKDTGVEALASAASKSSTVQQVSKAVSSGASLPQIAQAGASGMSTDLGSVASAAGSGLMSVGSKISDVLGKYITTSSGVDVNGLHPSLQQNVSNMAKDYFDQTGKKLAITSGHRSNEKQAELYRTMPKGMAAPPGSSLHNFGLAVDIDKAQANELASLGLLDKYGLSRPLLNAKKPEAWHVQPKGMSLAAAKAGIYSGEAPVNQATSVASNVGGLESAPAVGGAGQSVGGGSMSSGAGMPDGKSTVTSNSKASIADIPLVDPSDGFLNAMNVGIV